MDTEILFARGEFVAAYRGLRRLVKGRRLAAADVVLDLDEWSLKLSCAGNSATMSAQCSTAGRVIIAAATLKALRYLVRDFHDGMVRLLVTQDKLRLGAQSFPCRWVERPAASIRMAVNASFLDVLMLRYLYSDDELDAAGVQTLLARAEAQKANLISKAANTLEALCISRADIDGIVEERLKEYAEQHS